MNPRMNPMIILYHIIIISSSFSALIHLIIVLFILCNQIKRRPRSRKNRVRPLCSEAESNSTQLLYWVVKRSGMEFSQELPQGIRDLSRVVVTIDLMGSVEGTTEECL